MRSAFTTTFPMPEQTTLIHYASDSDNCLDDEDNDLFLDLSCEKADIEETIIRIIVPGKDFLVLLIHFSCGT